MRQKNRSSLACFISTVLLILNDLISSSKSARVEEHYANCAPRNLTCGLLYQNITYPFWDSSRPSYCGLPKFRLECQWDYLAITIQNQTYNILDIDYDSKVFTVAEQQFSQGPCPATKTQLKNTTLDFTLFDLTFNTVNATLFYNCSKTLDLNSTVGFSCPLNSYDLQPSSVNFLSTDEKWEDKLTESCETKIYVPVLRNEVTGVNNGSADVRKIVSKGFELKWVIDESQCEGCKGSNGTCGYNQSLGQPVCFCKDAVYNTTCPISKPPVQDPNKSNKVTLIGIGVASAVAASVVLILIFLYQRHKKNNQSSVHLVSEKGIPITFSTTLASNGSSYFGVNVFDYNELEKATNSFDPGKELGRGGFGSVYHGNLNGRNVAIKRLYENNNKMAGQFLNEVEILANLRHKNLVNLYGCTSRQSKELLLVYEYVPNGTVADHLHGRKESLRLLKWNRRLSIAVETASALVYLHASDVIHRDVKTQNILLDENFAVKVADFGLSRLFPLNVTHVSTAPQGTPGYVDPEYHQCYQLTEKSDVYSFGVVLAELISSKPAVDVTRRRAEINLSSMLTTKFQNGALVDFIDPLLGTEADDNMKEITKIAELAFQCLQSTREMRPSMEQVLERLYNIQDHKNKSDRAEVLEISSDDVFMLKGGDSSPTSSPRDDNTVGRVVPHASI